MAAEPADKPEERAAVALVLFEARRSATVRAQRCFRWRDHDWRSDPRRICVPNDGGDGQLACGVINNQF